MLDQYTLRTTGKTGDVQLSLVYRGPEPAAKLLCPFIEDRLYPAGTPRVHEAISCGPDVGNSRAGIGEADADVSIRVASMSSFGQAVPSRCIRMPLKVNFVVEYDTEGAPTTAPSARESKRQSQRVRRYDYAYSLSTSPADFDWFFERMHVPTMRARHALRARGLGMDEAREQIFRTGGFVFFLTSAGQRVAGVLCRSDGVICDARMVGWLDGDPIHLAREAVKSANHFLIDWAGRSGHGLLDFQGCEPFVTKGTFQSKRHLGAQAKLPHRNAERLVAELTVNADKSAIRDFLVENPPVLVAPDGSLAVGFFTDGTRPARTDIPHTCGGIEATAVIDLDGFLQ
jgi:hypothetical protein